MDAWRQRRAGVERVAAASRLDGRPPVHRRERRARATVVGDGTLGHFTGSFDYAYTNSTQGTLTITLRNTGTNGSLLFKRYEE